MMVATPSPTSLYATRWKPFLAALVFAGALVIDLLSTFIWPTPAITAHLWEYQEPAKTISFIVVLLICAPLIVLGLYWTLTPRPMLQLSVASLVYRPFPLPTRTIYWDDVEHVVAVATRQDTSLVTHTTMLTLSFTLKPDRLSAYRGQQRLDLDINLGTLSLHADELLQLMRNYHEVQVVRNPKHTKAERKTSRGSHKSSYERDGAR